MGKLGYLLLLFPFWAFGQNLPKGGKERADRLNALAEQQLDKEPQRARQYAYEALEIAEKQDYKLGKALAYKHIGLIYQLQGNPTQALEYFLKSLPLYEQARHKIGIAQLLHNIGVVYQELEKFSQARHYYDRVLEIDQQIQDRKGEASTLNNIADLYFRQGKTDDALRYYTHSLQIRQDIRDSAGIATSLKNIGLVRHSQQQYRPALTYLQKSLTIDEHLENNAQQAATLGNIAETYLKLQRIDSAEVFALGSFALAERIALKREMIAASGVLADIYQLRGEFEKALEYKNVQLLFKEDFFQEENSRKINDLQTSYELEKARAQNALLQKNQQFDRLWIASGTVVGLLAAALAMVFYVSNQRKHKINLLLQSSHAKVIQEKQEISHQNEIILAQNHAIETQLKTIEEQNAEIAEKSENITSSIRYAKRIQQAMLPYESLISEAFPSNFIFYLPRDVVSGDFYWFAKVEAKPLYIERETFNGIERTFAGFQNELAIIAAVDCTGHGVPGALMSMIGNAQLNQIVKDEGYTEAGKILEALHEGIRIILKQQETHNRDGMDMALCVIDQEEKKLAYAGAKNTLVYVQNNELGELKANPYAVGGFQDEDEKRHYETYHLDFAEHPLRIYLYSDGYADQFGGADHKKFMRKNFKKLLFDIHQEPMAFQRDIIEKNFTDWKGALPQVDDVLVMGIKLG